MGKIIFTQFGNRTTGGVAGQVHTKTKIEASTTLRNYLKYFVIHIPGLIALDGDPKKVLHEFEEYGELLVEALEHEFGPIRFMWEDGVPCVVRDL